MSKKAKKIIGNILIGLLFIGVSAYIVFQFVRANVNKYETDLSSYVRFNSTTQVQAVIFRDEKLIEKNGSGAVRYLVSNGARVGSGDSICNLYSRNVNISDFVLADSLRNKLEMYRKSTIGASASQTDISAIDNAAKDNYFAMISGLADGNYLEAKNRGNNTVIQLNKRLMAVGKMTGYESMMTDLTLQINKLEGGSASPDKVITAPSSGYFYKSTDGYENIFKPRLLDSITIEDYEKLVSTPVQSEDKDKFIGKLCSSYKWYFTCEVNSDIAAGLVLDKTYSVVFPLNSSQPINATLYRKIEQPKFEKAVLVFVTYDSAQDFNFRRMQNVYLSSNAKEGVRVPTEAVRIVNGTTGVYVIVGNKIEFRKIDIIHSTGIYYISAIHSNDTPDESGHIYLGINESLIISGKEIYEGRIID